MSAARSTSGSLSVFTVNTWLPRSTAVEYLVLWVVSSLPKMSLKKFLMLAPMPGSLSASVVVVPLPAMEPPGAVSSPCDRRTSELEKPDESSSFLALTASA